MNTTLYYRQGGSDKIYQARIDGDDDTGYTVNIAYGRRGATLTTGTKTQNPVTYEAATKIYEKLIAEKQSKGYSPGEDGSPYQNTAKAGQVSGHLPQLLNTITEYEASKLIDNQSWLMQEKFDGRRMILRKVGGTVDAINKRGLVIDAPQPIIDAAQQIPSDFTIDGEAIGDTFYAFDLLAVDGQDVRDTECIERLAILVGLLWPSKTGQRNIAQVPTWLSTDEKADKLWELRSGGAEGVVFKRTDSPYRAGRPNTGGTQLKLKFTATLSAVVARVNAKRSVSVSLLDGEDWLCVGDVAIPANANIPAVGDVIEVRYLYATTGNRLYQTVYLGLRDDILPSECLTSQMQFKEETR